MHPQLPLPLAVQTTSPPSTPQTFAIKRQGPDHAFRAHHTLAPHLGPHTVHQHLPHCIPVHLGEKPWPRGIRNRGQPPLPHPARRAHAGALIQLMTAADLQEQRPQHRLYHLEERPSPPSGTSWVGDPAQLRSHVALAKKSTHPFAESRITHGLTPSPAEPAGRGTCTPYSTGSVHHFQPTCEFAAPPPSALLPAPPAGSSPSRTSLLLGRSANLV